MSENKDPLDPVDAHRMPLIDHLVELRDRLVRIIIFASIGCVACFGFAQPIWEALVNPMNEALAATGRGTMAITEPLEGFMTYLKVAALAGIGLASPFIFHQVWSFIAPGLYPKEKKAIAPLAVASTVLFFRWWSGFCCFLFLSRLSFLMHCRYLHLPIMHR